MLAFSLLPDFHRLRWHQFAWRTPTNATTAQSIVSLVRLTSMSGRPGLAAPGTLRPLSTAIRRNPVTG